MVFCIFMVRNLIEDLFVFLRNFDLDSFGCKMLVISILQPKESNKWLLPIIIIICINIQLTFRKNLTFYTNFYIWLSSMNYYLFFKCNQLYFAKLQLTFRKKSNICSNWHVFTLNNVTPNEHCYISKNLWRIRNFKF